GGAEGGRGGDRQAGRAALVRADARDGDDLRLGETGDGQGQRGQELAGGAHRQAQGRQRDPQLVGRRRPRRRGRRGGGGRGRGATATAAGGRRHRRRGRPDELAPAGQGPPR